MRVVLDHCDICAEVQAVGDGLVFPKVVEYQHKLALTEKLTHAYKRGLDDAGVGAFWRAMTDRLEYLRANDALVNNVAPVRCNVDASLCNPAKVDVVHCAISSGAGHIISSEPGTYVATGGRLGGGHNINVVATVSYLAARPV